MWQSDLLGNGFDEFNDIFTDVKSSISDAIDDLREHFIYVPFHLGEIFYVLERSHEVINGYAKEWYVVKTKIIEICVTGKPKSEMVIICLEAVEQPEKTFRCVLSECNEIFFKDKGEAQAKCDDINSWLKRIQEENQK